GIESGPDDDGSFKPLTILVITPSVTGSRNIDKTARGEASGKEICHESEVKQNLWSRDILEDIDNNLAADFDGSLSGLGVDLSAASYNMSEALLALPSLTVFKEEVPSPSHTSNNDGKNMLHLSSTVVGKRPNTAIGTEFASFSHLLQTQHFWHHQSSGFTNESHALTSGVGTGSVSSLASSSSVEGNPSRDLNALGSCSGDILHDYKYQYTLGAATSVATKMNEENLAYLNQGQSYELKLRRFGREGEKGKMLKSVVRLCFHDRRLQYMEKEQIMAWRQANPGSRILEIDIPLSYGITDVIQDQVNLNAATFTWDPAKEVGVFIKVHCISTEFTPKKHGGEKGVPFRLQLESFDADDPVAKRHHAAACQIKVFKLKGGDRKHKQDREKLMKRPPSEQEKYQPQSRFTLFTDIPVESLTSLQSTNDLASAAKENQGNSNPNKPAFYVGDNENPPRLDGANETVSIVETNTLCSQVLRPESTSTQVFQWLQANRFGSYNSLFNFFSGADMLRLTRDDFVQVVGVADGIRLFNSLHSKPIIPRLTLYVSVNQKQVYNAIYMPVLNCSELRSRLLLVMQLSSSKLKDVFLWGPGGIHILVTDEVVQNFKNDSSYNIEIVKEKSDDYFSLVLKPLVNY
ncbi:hypothetical protein QYM36_000740, partial [Artemia franciscana]